MMSDSKCVGRNVASKQFMTAYRLFFLAESLENFIVRTLTSLTANTPNFKVCDKLTISERSRRLPV
jgi:hypothetical protein